MNLECIPCFQRQAIDAARMATEDTGKQAYILRKAIDILRGCDWDSKPPKFAQQIHGMIRRELGTDPYDDVKRKSNDSILALYPDLKVRVRESGDTINTSVRMAIAGNIMDFGPTSSFDFEGTLEDCLKRDLSIDQCDSFKDACSKSSNILYLTDNAGEIVCDRILLEEIIDNYNVKKITLAVKGGNILNDATYQDISYVGLDKLPGVDVLCVSNGDPCSGIPRESHAFRNVMDRYDMIISKGQGNYEMLSEHDDVFFLLKAKCQLIARNAGVPMGGMICGKNLS